MLLRKGAEANIYVDKWYGLNVIKKIRIPKSYRLPPLDLEIRRKRVVREAQLIHDAKRAGVLTPFIYFIDLNKTMIIMENVEGVRVKEIFHQFIPETKRICVIMGGIIGKLHRNGIIHGDLTTSNFILTNKKTICLIDFGLSEHSRELEKMGVDIHLMKRALESTHYQYSEDYFNLILKGYTREVGGQFSSDVLKRVQEIGQRGRYSVK